VNHALVGPHTPSCWPLLAVGEEIAGPFIGVVESRKGAVSHRNALRLPSHRVVGGSHPPPTPTERGVRSYRTTLFGS
jgi:hypothetical protein